MNWLYDKFFNLEFKDDMKLKRRCFYIALVSVGIFLLSFYIAFLTNGVISVIFTIICVICVTVAVVLYLYSISPNT